MPRIAPRLLLPCLLLLNGLFVSAQEVALPPSPAEQVQPVETINDPIEPVNRAFFRFNDLLLRWAIDPAARGYRLIAPKPVRRGIGRFGDNLAYPLRLINTLLQGEPDKAWNETKRFGINTTEGILGFLDPARTRHGLKPHEEDFGQTFGKWGAGPGFYFVMPVLGPSSGRDTLAWPLDSLANPATYAPGLRPFLGFNELSFFTPALVRLGRTEQDPYVMTRDIAALVREREVLDYEPFNGEIKPSPTLQAIFLDVRDPEFPYQSLERRVKIERTGRELPYNIWMQPRPAPLVFVLGGVGSHRLSESDMALAEMLYRRGYSAVTVSSAMNWEFMESAATAMVPGYTPVDATDVYMALDTIWGDLDATYPGAFTRKALMGVSLGALHTLFISTFEGGPSGEMLTFDRFEAINPPVDLQYALSSLDSYYNAPLTWPASEREGRIRNTLFKAVQLSERDLTPSIELPFDEIESQYLIGLNFRLILRDVIFASQQRHDLGVLRHDTNAFSRDTVYREIAQYSFARYMREFVLPYYLEHTDLVQNEDELADRSNLMSIDHLLRLNDKIRVYANKNDFLLQPEDIAWLEVVFDGHLTIYDEGGHLGNLHTDRVQNELIEGLSDLMSQAEQDVRSDPAPRAIQGEIQWPIQSA